MASVDTGKAPSPSQFSSAQSSRRRDISCLRASLPGRGPWSAALFVWIAIADSPYFGCPIIHTKPRSAGWGREEVAEFGGDVLHEEFHGLPAFFGWIPVLGKLEEGAEAADMIVDFFDGLEALVGVANDPAVVHEVGDGEGVVGHGLVIPS